MKRKLIQGVIQVVVFSFIPFIYYVIARGTIFGFFNFLGFTGIQIDSGFLIYNILLILIIGVLSIIPVIYMFKKGIFNDEKVIVNSYQSKEFGLTLIIEILISSILITSLSEEILFRGFLAKVFIGSFGFVIGNLIHSIIFGLIHGLPLKKYGWSVVIVASSFPTIVAYILAWNNEVNYSGSIIPSLFIHAVVNIVSSIILLKLLGLNKEKLEGKRI